MTYPNARLYALIARDARRAVVFRRGPSKQVLVLVWNLKDDALVPGQWFKGRIHERRCDLSPDGELLAYFAAKHRGPFGTWTAVSRPPYLTALALWPKGDTWGGGALFEDGRSLALNHRSGHMELAEGFAVPTGLDVRRLGTCAGSGEDEPILTMRLERDGWRLKEAGLRSKDRQSTVHYPFDSPRVVEKQLGRQGLAVRVNLHGIGEEGGTWYVETSQVVGPTGVLEDLGRVDWADVDHNGDVLFARDGCLFRRRHAQLRSGAKAEPAKLVADLNDLHFDSIVSPRSARSWPRNAR